MYTLYSTASVLCPNQLSYKRTQPLIKVREGIHGFLGDSQHVPSTCTSFRLILYRCYLYIQHNTYHTTLAHTYTVHSIIMASSKEYSAEEVQQHNKEGNAVSTTACLSSMTAAADAAPPLHLLCCIANTSHAFVCCCHSCTPRSHPIIHHRTVDHYRRWCIRYLQICR